MSRLIAIVVRFLPHHHRRTADQFIRFCVVGLFNTVLDFAVYMALTRTSDFWYEHLVGAAVLSFCAGAVSSFLLNNFWTFRQDASGWHGRIGKFMVVAAGGMAWNAIIIASLLNFGVYDVIAKVFATVCVVAWNFSLQKLWTFKA